MTEQEAMQGLVDRTIRLRNIPQFLNNRKVVLAAVAIEGIALEYAQFKEDSEIVLAAVCQNGLALQYACPKLKADKKIVLAAVTQDGIAFQFASKELNNDHNIVLAAVSQHGEALYYASSELKMNREIVLAALTQLKIDFSSMINSSIDDIFFKHLPENLNIFRLANQRLRNNKSFVFLALTLINAKLNLQQLSHPNTIVFNILYRPESHIGEDLKNEIGSHEPIAYLEKFLLNQKLEQKLTHKKIKNKRTKI